MHQSGGGHDDVESSGDDSPLGQGAGGDLRNPPRWGWRRRRLWNFSRILALGTRVFRYEGIYIGEEAASGEPGVGSPHLGPPGVLAACGDPAYHCMV